MNDSEYFKKRYQLFIRFIKENNLYEEYRRIREKVSVCVSNNTMLGKKMRSKRNIKKLNNRLLDRLL